MYVLSTDGGKIETVATAPGALPTNLSLFTSSPDGKLAAVVESGNDAVAVVDLAPGAVEVISPSLSGWQCRTMPAWRSSSELSFAALGKSGYPEWMLWSKVGGVHPISGKWPARAPQTGCRKRAPRRNPPAESEARYFAPCLHHPNLMGLGSWSRSLQEAGFRGRTTRDVQDAARFADRACKCLLESRNCPPK
ncbi:MAG: hypothetical protein M0Q93_05220 [Terrimicrobiaceae bacterium]|nr:hypothetical protein [Terrimicrobiaceae bacterium]